MPPSKAAEIISRHAAGWTPTQLGKAFAMNSKAISNLLKNATPEQRLEVNLLPPAPTPPNDKFTDRELSHIAVLGRFVLAALGWLSDHTNVNAVSDATGIPMRKLNKVANMRDEFTFSELALFANHLGLGPDELLLFAYSQEPNKHRRTILDRFPHRRPKAPLDTTVRRESR